MGGGFEQLVHEISSVHADVIALQEVTPKFYKDILASKAGYPYRQFNQHIDGEDGLAVLSKYPIDSCTFLQENADYADSKA